MKIISVVFTTVFIFSDISAQEVPDFVKRELDTMLYYDQLVRKQNMLGEKTWIAFNNKPKHIKDSVWEKIQYYDSINFDKLVRLLDSYSYTDYV